MTVVELKFDVLFFFFLCVFTEIPLGKLLSFGPRCVRDSNHHEKKKRGWLERVGRAWTYAAVVYSSFVWGREQTIERDREIRHRLTSFLFDVRAGWPLGRVCSLDLEKVERSDEI